MSEVDEYLISITDPEQKAALQRICDAVLRVVPKAEPGRSYGMPAYKYNRRPLVGFIAAKDHLSLFPFSPPVIEALKDMLQNYELSKGTIRFTVDNQLPDELLEAIVAARLKEIS